jgi:S-(hydroxymethyl)glutathione dehydrogenase/alcohol dehydrogenase
MTLRFRAAVLSEAGRKLRIDTVEAEPPRAGEVLVRIAAAGLCHTDLEVIQGQLVYPMPIVLGHEAARASRFTRRSGRPITAARWGVAKR